MAKDLNSLPYTQAEVLSYPGLHNEDSPFSFQQCIDATFEQIQRRISKEKPDQVFLMGHSFGGFVSLALSKKLQHPSLKVVLLAPFTHWSYPNQPAELLMEVHQLYPKQFPVQILDSLTQEISTLVQTFDFNQTAHSWLAEENLILILGKQDTVFPPAHLNEFLAQFKNKKFKLYELEDDHSFTMAPEKVFQSISANL